MSRKSRRTPPRRQARAQADLSNPNLGTSPTADGGAAADNTSTTPPGTVQYAVPVYGYEQAPDREDGDDGARIVKIVLSAVGGVVTVATVIVTASILLIGIGDIEDTVEDVANVSKENSSQLRSLESSVDRIEREVNETKDLVQEIRYNRTMPVGRDVPESTDQDAATEEQEPE